MSKARDINFLTKNFTNCWCGEWLLINEKVILNNSGSKWKLIRSLSHQQFVKMLENSL